MDSKQFDELVARLASAATRRDAVKGALGGTLASVGVTSVASAKKKGKATAEKNKKNKKKKKPFCHCPDSNIRNCVTIKLKKNARENHLRSHPFDREGACPYG